jgi:hypothetical protein
MDMPAAGDTGSDRLRMASYPVVAILVLGAVALGLVSVRLALLPLAVLLGWSHLRSI